MSQSAPPVEQLRAWTYRRLGLAGAAVTPQGALAGAVAVYSSHPTAPLALLCRCPGLDEQAFRALEGERAAVRLPAMRGSIFLAPAASAARLFVAHRPPLETHAERLEYAGVDWDTYARMKPALLEAARQPLTPAQVEQALRDAGFALAGVRPTAVARVMAREGLVLRVGSSLRSDRLSYVAADAWLGGPLEADADEALRWLAGAYLAAYGPARVKDFAWWTGASQRRAAAALDGLGVDCGGGWLLPAELLDGFGAAEPLDPAALVALPKWDAYTMGYAPDGRQRLVDDAHLRLAYSQGGGGTLHGDGFPLLLRGGRAVARWSHKFAGQRLQVEVAPFAPGLLDDDPAPAFAAIGALLGAKALDLSLAAPAG
ncbi:MAG TPA: crosslink repair DNA glycosylase YcaQ family protein [Herpetosiphonaceae bacterium]